MPDLSAYRIQAELEQEFGISIGHLGCVLLTCEQISTGYLLPDWGYYSTDPNRPHIRGLEPNEKGTHVTLLYGLLRNANVIKDLVDKALEGWTPEPVRIRDFTLFDSSFEDEPYKVLVADVASNNLLEAHQRLSMLPHINTYPTYRPHATVGYIKAEYAEQALAMSQRWLFNYPDLKPTGIDYGFPDTESPWPKGRDCGGCKGLGKHSPRCPTQPGWHYKRLADTAEGLGDQIGTNEPGMANRAYSIAGWATERQRAEQDRHGR